MVRPSNEINTAKDPSLSDSTTANPQNRTLCAQWERAPTGRLCMALRRAVIMMLGAGCSITYVRSHNETKLCGNCAECKEGTEFKELTKRWMRERWNQKEKELNLVSHLAASGSLGHVDHCSLFVLVAPWAILLMLVSS